MPVIDDFQFPPNLADENEGLGDAGIETFRDAPYASVGRENGQNSNDAPDGSGRAGAAAGSGSAYVAC